MRFERGKYDIKYDKYDIKYEKYRYENFCIRKEIKTILHPHPLGLVAPAGVSGHRGGESSGGRWLVRGAGEDF